MGNFLDFLRPQFTPVGGNTSIFSWDIWRRKWVPANNIYHYAREKVTGERVETLVIPKKQQRQYEEYAAMNRDATAMHLSWTTDLSASGTAGIQGSIATIPQTWKPALTYGGENHVSPFKWWLYNIIYECAPIPSMLGRVIIFSRSAMLSVHSQLKPCQP